MTDDEVQDIHEAVNAALQDLALRLGGSTDTGGPVENVTQIKGRGDLGLLLTDVDNLVLGRVWVEFGAGVDVPDIDSQQDGEVHVQAEVCSEIVEPRVPVGEWAQGR